jgi:hypothetical protein
MILPGSPWQLMPKRFLMSTGRIVIICGNADEVRSAELGIAYC